MPTLADLLQLQQNANAYVGYPQLQRQAARMQQAQAGRIPENLQDPRTYGFVRGMLGSGSDDLGMSVMSPNTAKAKEAAYYGNQLSNLAQIAPAAAPALKGYGRLAGEAINDAMMYGKGPLAKITPQSMKMVEDTAYKGSHVAPNWKTYGAPLHDLTQIMPADVYSQSGKELYGIGDRLTDSEWRIAALKARNKPDAMIDVYRAVPKGVKDINHGDWVTTSPNYAKWHGENVLDGDYDIVKKSVKAKTLSTEGYPYEFGYHENND